LTFPIPLCNPLPVTLLVHTTVISLVLLWRGLPPSSDQLVEISSLFRLVAARTNTRPTQPRIPVVGLIPITPPTCLESGTPIREAAAAATAAAAAAASHVSGSRRFVLEMPVALLVSK